MVCRVTDVSFLENRFYKIHFYLSNVLYFRFKLANQSVNGYEIGKTKKCRKTSC